MARRLQIRKGTADEHTNFTGANGELTYDETNKRIRFHDGVTVGGIPLAKVSDSGLPLGVPVWHNGTENQIPVAHVPYNGQLLSRTTYPAMWAKVQSTFQKITDAEWLADPKKRGYYSTGDGSTTFRMPDLNGVQEGSIKAPVLRGHGGGTVADEVKTIGQIDVFAIPEHKHNLITGRNDSGDYHTSGSNKGHVGNGYTALYNAGDSWIGAVTNTNVATENRMNSVYGIWICRVGDTTTEIAEPTKHAVLTGGNTFSGSQKIVGSLSVSGDVQVSGATNLLKAIQALGSSDTLNINQLVANTWYTNTTGRPIFVSCNTSGTNVSATITVRKNGVDTIVSHQFIGNNFAVNVGSSGIVLNGLEYKVSSNTNVWF